MANELTVELRGPCPKDVVDVLDGFSMARRMSRNDLVNQILTEWADIRCHETSLVVALARGNPSLMDKLGIERK